MPLILHFRGIHCSEVSPMFPPATRVFLCREVLPHLNRGSEDTGCRSLFRLESPLRRCDWEIFKQNIKRAETLKNTDRWSWEHWSSRNKRYLGKPWVLAFMWIWTSLPNTIVDQVPPPMATATLDGSGPPSRTMRKNCSGISGGTWPLMSMAHPSVSGPQTGPWQRKSLRHQPGLWWPRISVLSSIHRKSRNKSLEAPSWIVLGPDRSRHGHRTFRSVLWWLAPGGWRLFLRVLWVVRMGL